jgi:hypothetical protein
MFAMDVELLYSLESSTIKTVLEDPVIFYGDCRGGEKVVSG